MSELPCGWKWRERKHDHHRANAVAEIRLIDAPAQISCGATLRIPSGTGLTFGMSGCL